MTAAAPPPPARVTLTDPQQEAVEEAAERGYFYLPPKGQPRARWRWDRAEALQRKGIFGMEDPAPYERDDGYVCRLTDYGRQVYEQHPRIIRRGRRG